MNKNEIYFAMGDSITTGYGVGLNQSFATLFYKNLLTDFPGLMYENYGVDGLTSGGLATMLGQSRVTTLVRLSRIISLTIGPNDLLAVGKGLISGAGANIDYTLGNLNQHLMTIGERLRMANPTAVVKIATIYNPLPPMDKQSGALALGLVKTANHSIVQVARHFGFVVIPVDKVFKGKEQFLLGRDHLHPNIAGHQVIADLFSRY